MSQANVDTAAQNGWILTEEEYIKQQSAPSWGV